MDKIIMADGSVYFCSFLATDGNGTLWIILNGQDLSSSVSILANPSKTSEMKWSKYRLVGYTSLFFAVAEGSGVRCGLMGGHDELIMEEEAND